MITEKRAEELRNKMRQEWKHNEELFDAERAINQSYGFNQGIGAMIDSLDWYEVFTVEFEKEWADYMYKVRRA